LQKTNHKNYQRQKWNGISRCICLFILVVSSLHSLAQSNDSSKNVSIDLTAKNVFYTKTDTGEFHKFVGDAVFIQGTDTLYCDSLLQNSTSKNIEAFGDVKMHQAGGTQAQSDYLRYTSAKKLAYMRGNVVLTDGKNNLRCQELTYDLGTKTGVYENGGTLKTDSTTVTSMEGEYRVNAKDARFKKNVVVTDVRYHIVSDDMGYNTDTKLVTFFSPSVVTSDSGRSKLKTSNGTYDSRTGTAHFIGHSSVFNDDHYLEGDSIYYNKLTGYGYANGNVISIDTTHHSKLYCGHLEYFKFKRIMWATIKPVLEQINGKDTLYIRADTFYSFPVAKKPLKTKRTNAGDFSLINKNNTSIVPLLTYYSETNSTGIDSIVKNQTLDAAGILTALIPNMEKVKQADTSKIIAQNKPNRTATDTLSKNANGNIGIEKPQTTSFSFGVAPKKQTKTDQIAIKEQRKANTKRGISVGTKEPKTDTVAADTTAPLVFTGYHHVLIFSDSLQGKCDSVSYCQSDSTIRMMYDPIAWSHQSQITGDTILLHLDDSGKLKSMYVPNNSFVVSQSGPAKAQLFDQVQGKTLTGYFVKNTISKLVVVPNSEAIYYSKDGKGAYVGESEAKSERMKIFFENQNIDKIIFEKDITQTLTPMEKVDIPAARLSRFKWLMDQRPKSKKELFDK